MTTTSRIGRVTRGARSGRAWAGQTIGRMALAVPAGTIDPSQFSSVVVGISRWQVRNDGDLAGAVGGHIIIQRRGGLLDSKEISIIEGDWVENASPPTPRLRVQALNTSVTGSVRTAITWNPTQFLVQPGTIKNLAFHMTIGMDLIAGDSDLDVVAIVDRLPEASGIAEERSANAFSVGAPSTPPLAPQNFGPVALNQPLVEIFPQR